MQRLRCTKHCAGYMGYHDLLNTKKPARPRIYLGFRALIRAVIYALGAERLLIIEPFFCLRCFCVRFL